jgi:Shedu protein SduA, C-terminal
MKEFKTIVFDPAKCRKQLSQFKKLLDSKKVLIERKELQPFFRSREQLTAFFGTYAPDIGPANRLAYEFPLFGDFAADIVLGNADIGEYCLIELEDAGATSILRKVKGKATKEWAPRFDHGCSQLVDWFYALDDMKKTGAFAKHFGHGHIKFFGLLVIGRSDDLSDDDRTRLKWRTEKVLVDSHPLTCLTFDEIYLHLERRIMYYPAAAQLEKK